MKFSLSFLKAILICVAMFTSVGISAGNIILTIQEEGANVVASYSGILDTSGFNTVNKDSEAGFIKPSSGMFSALNDANLPSGGPGLSQVRSGDWTQAPTTFGSGDRAPADGFDIPAGNSFGFNQNTIFVSPSYSSSSQLGGSLIFQNHDFSSLGIIAGTYTGTTSNDVTVTINAIPEPNSYGFLLGAAGLATALFFRRRRGSSAT
jgi:hypothetical protein